MSRRWVGLVLGTILGCGCLGDRAAEAFWGARTPAQRTARYLNSPPGAQMVPQKVDGPVAGSQPVATFDYGYFGARNRPSMVNHRDYYGEVRQTLLPAGL